MPVLWETKPLAALERRETLVHARFEHWSFGPLTMFRTQPSTLPFPPTQFVAIAVHEGGQAVHRVDDVTRVVRPGDLVILDLTRPFDLTWQGYGASRTLQVPLDLLGLPPDILRRGAPRLESSPLYRLVSGHIRELSRDADRLSATNAAAALGCATIDLVRALVISAADGAPDPHDVADQTLVTQIRAYVRGHLSDPALTPATIASALAVSPRRLYRACSAADLRLTQWIITARLECAKAELGDPRTGRHSIAVVARRWGFKDPTHFTRRFRAAYGMLPSAWRAQVQ